MKKFCLLLLVIGAALWWFCDVIYLIGHPIFFTIFFTLALALALSGLLYMAALEDRVRALEKQIQELESPDQSKHTENREQS